MQNKKSIFFSNIIAQTTDTALLFHFTKASQFLLLSQKILRKKMRKLLLNPQKDEHIFLVIKFLYVTTSYVKYKIRVQFYGLKKQYEIAFLLSHSIEKILFCKGEKKPVIRYFLFYFFFIFEIAFGKASSNKKKYFYKINIDIPV